MKKQWIDIGHHTAQEEREQVNNPYFLKVVFRLQGREGETK